METWIWRRMEKIRMEKIGWVVRISNEEVLQIANETKTMLDVHSEKTQTCVVMACAKT